MNDKRTPGFAIVSGASSGIGLACAKELARQGHPLALIARDAARLEKARALVEQAGSPEILVFSADVTDAQACARIVESVAVRRGSIDWLITCAGDVEPGMFHELSVDAHRRQMELNYFGTLQLAAPVAKRMIDQQAGNIVLISSAAAILGVAGYSAYGASKFAVRGLGEALSVELAPHGVVCSVAFPPDTATPQLERERVLRPWITEQIAAGAPVADPDVLAVRMICDAKRGRFILAPSMQFRAYAWLSSLYAPFFRRWQRKLLDRASPPQTAPKD
jgi:3-dehydrosphinganine reductase